MAARLLFELVGNATSAVAAFKKTNDAAAESSKKTTSAWGSIGKAAAVVGGAVAAAKVVDFAKQSITAASDLNESWSKVGVVFGSQAGKVQAWSKTSATAMGLSQQAALEAAGTYGNLAVALGLPPEQAAKMSTSLVGLAGDLASFNNVPVGDALDALKSGLVGEAEPLRRFGVSISATRVEAQALAMGLAKAPVDMRKVGAASSRLEIAQANLARAIKAHGQNSLQAKRALAGVESAQQGVSKAMAGGKVNLSDAAKAQATYALIMKDTKTAQGDFARTSGGLANQQRIAAAMTENLKASLGQALLPTVVKLAGVFTRDLMPVIRVVADLFSKYSGILLPVGAAILVVVGAVKAWNVVQMILNSELWGMVAALLANPITWIVIGVVALITAIVLLATKTRFFQTVWAAMTGAVTAAWRAVTGAIVAAWNWVWGIFQTVFRWVKGNWPLLLGILTGPVGLAAALIYKYWDQISRAAGNLVRTIGRFFAMVFGYITAPFISAYNAVVGWLSRIPGYVSGVVGAVGRFFAGVYGAITGPFSSAIGWVAGVPGMIGRVLGGVVGAVASAFAGVFNAVIGPFQRAWSWIQSNILGPLRGAWNGFANTLNSVSISTPSVSVLGHEIVPAFHWTPPWHIPTLAAGGLMTRTGLVYAHRGEVISPAPKAATTVRTGPLVTIGEVRLGERIDVATFAQRLAWQLRTATP